MKRIMGLYVHIYLNAPQSVETHIFLDYLHLLLDFWTEVMLHPCNINIILMFLFFLDMIFDIFWQTTSNYIIVFILRSSYCSTLQQARRS